MRTPRTAQHNPVYEDIATKFFEHFLHIAEAMNNISESGVGLWTRVILLRRFESPGGDGIHQD
jgi:hypothetical protein